VRAVQDLTRAQELSPGNPSLALHLAWAYQTNGDVDQARRAFRKAVDLGWKVANSDPLEHKLMEKMRRDLGIAGN